MVNLECFLVDDPFNEQCIHGWWYKKKKVDGWIMKSNYYSENDTVKMACKGNNAKLKS